MAIALSVGEPAGIGPDITLQLLQRELSDVAVLFADKNVLMQRATQLALPLQLIDWLPGIEAQTHHPGTAYIHHIPTQSAVIPGQLNPSNAAYVIQCLEAATQACLNHQCRGLVTAPVHKAVINDAGIVFTGHTEFLQALTDTDEVVMSFSSDIIDMALMTTHVPLHQVSSAITQELLIKKINIINNAYSQPRMIVCGLNPHAGESGHLGREEQDIIIPTLSLLKQQGLNLLGPLPADTAFTPRYIKQADIIIAMYHDQGLAPIKALAFNQLVNITLGLPIKRYSVDHGTALDIAGTHKANADSLFLAFNKACEH